MSRESSAAEKNYTVGGAEAPEAPRNPIDKRGEKLARAEAKGFTVPTDLQKDFATLADRFKAAKIMDSSFNLRQISSGEAPDFVLEDVKKLSEKYGAKNVDELFDALQQQLTNLKKENPNALLDPANKETLEKFRELTDLRTSWTTEIMQRDAIKGREKRAQERAKAEAAEESFKDIVKSIKKGDYTFVADMTPEEIKNSLIPQLEAQLASITNPKEADKFYEQIRPLYQNAGEAVTASVSNAWGRRSRSEMETGVGSVGTGGNSTTKAMERGATPSFSRVEKPKTEVRGTGETLEIPQVKQESAFRNFWRSITRNYSDTKSQSKVDTATYGSDPAGGKEPGLISRLWNKLKGSNKETAEQKIDSKVAKVFEKKYRSTVLKLKELGTNFSEASKFAGITEQEKKIAMDILMGKKEASSLSKSEATQLKQALEKAAKYTNEKPDNKARDVLFDLYSAAVKEVGLDYTPGEAAAARLLARRGAKMASIGNPTERGGVGTPR